MSKLIRTIPKATPRILGIKSIQHRTSQKCEIIDTGGASILKVEIKQGDQITLRRASMLASFSDTNTQLRCINGFKESLKRRLLGVEVFVEQLDTSKDGSILLASQGSIALLEMDNSRDVIFRNNSFLMESGLSLSSSTIGFRLGQHIFYGQASGTGFLALCHSDGLVGVNLEINEELLVTAGRVIAFDSILKVATSRPYSLPLSKRAVPRKLEWMTKRGIPFRLAAEALLYYTTDFCAIIVNAFRYWILGERGYLTITGPGQLILTLGANQK